MTYIHRTERNEIGLSILLVTLLILIMTALTPAGTPVAGSHHEEEKFGVCGESMSYWHPPVVDDCATGHEHGDPPPAWISEAGYDVQFHGHFSTSPIENTLKHAGMKGFAIRFNDVDLYFRLHAFSNALDRSARFHSYEVWARDPSGDVSHWQGWMNTGDPDVDRYIRLRGDRPTPPFMFVVPQESYDAGDRCEQWYVRTAEWSWNMTWTICGSTTIYYPGENEEQDMKYWRLPPDGTLGNVRRLEASWTAERAPRGEFVTTQFGEIVSGLDDPRCSETTEAYGVVYENVCLEQYLAPTMIPTRGNSPDREFDATGVQIPN